jgi:hypothetical protein
VLSYIVKILITVAVVISASEIAKRFPALGAMVVALPITSIIAMSFLYYDTKDSTKLSEFSRSIPPVVIPSIAFFYAFSYLIDRSFSFVMAILLASLIMLSIYGLYLFLLTRIGL